jgi:hypothetical protein
VRRPVRRVRPAGATWHVHFPVQAWACDWYRAAAPLTPRGERCNWRATRFSACYASSIAARATKIAARATKHPSQLHMPQNIPIGVLVRGIANVMAFSNHKSQQQRSKRTTSVPVHNRAFERIGSSATCRSGSGQTFPVLKQQNNPGSSHMNSKIQFSEKVAALPTPVRKYESTRL